MMEISLCFIIPYFSLSFGFALMDLCFSKYRFTSHANNNNILNQYCRFSTTVFLNVCIILPFILEILSTCLVKPRITEFSHLEMALDQIFFMAIFEVVFYSIHKLLHQPIFYRLIHYQHHQMVDCIGFGALYCHWIEFLFGNMLPTVIGPIIMEDVHLYSLCTWSFLAASNVVISHSGYSLFDTSHLIHHAVRTKNYGTMKFMDYLFDH